MKKQPKTILTIETLEKFERVINLDPKLYDIDLMVMPGTLEDKHKNCEHIPALRRQFNLIYLLLDGEHDVRLGADHTQLNPCDLVIVPENMVYASNHIRNCRGYCVHFKTEFIQPLLAKTLAEEFPFFQFDAEHIINLDAVGSENIRQAFKDIIREYQSNSPEKNYLLRNYILILLLKVRQLYTQHVRRLEKTISRSQQLATRFKHLVETHFTGMRTVNEYAGQLNITPKHLSDVVKETFGRSPLEMIHDMLLLEAKVLLGSTDKSISEIAFDLGFDDHAHFSHFIKKLSGLSPTELRKKL